MNLVLIKREKTNQKKAAFKTSLYLTLTALLITAPFFPSETHAKKRRTTSPRSAQTQDQAISPSPASDFQFERIEEKRLYFKSLKNSTESHYFEAPVKPSAFIGFINNTYFLFKAPSCVDCSTKATEALYVASLTVADFQPARLIPPGTVEDPATKQKLFESRMFYGKCFSQKSEGVFSFNSDYIEKKRRKPKLVQSFYEFIPTVHAQSDQVIAEVTEKLTEKRKPSLAQMKPYLKKNLCFEIDGSRRSATHFQLDMTPTRDDEDEEEDTQMSQDDTTDAETSSIGAVLAPRSMSSQKRLPASK